MKNAYQLDIPYKHLTINVVALYCANIVRLAVNLYQISGSQARKLKKPYYA